MPISAVDATTFASSVLLAPGPIVVEFMSYGCSHCREIEPVLQQVAMTLAGSVSIVRVNVAIERELADRYGIRATPTLVMFLNGTEVDRVEGPPPQAASLATALTRSFAT